MAIFINPSKLWMDWLNTLEDTVGNLKNCNLSIHFIVEGQGCPSAI